MPSLELPSTSVTMLLTSTSPCKNTTSSCLRLYSLTICSELEREQKAAQFFENTPSQDLSIKEGEKIKVKIAGLVPYALFTANVLICMQGKRSEKKNSSGSTGVLAPPSAAPRPAAKPDTIYSFDVFGNSSEAASSSTTSNDAFGSSDPFASNSSGFSR